MPILANSLIVYACGGRYLCLMTSERHSNGKQFECRGWSNAHMDGRWQIKDRSEVIPILHRVLPCHSKKSIQARIIHPAIHLLCNDILQRKAVGKWHSRVLISVYVYVSIHPSLHEHKTSVFFPVLAYLGTQGHIYRIRSVGRGSPQPRVRDRMSPPVTVQPKMASTSFSRLLICHSLQKALR